ARARLAPNPVTSDPQVRLSHSVSYSEERYISVIGLGRVGLPLALSFADRGMRVLGVDHDPAVLESIRAGRMPFSEAGTQELLERVRARGSLQLASHAAEAAEADDIVITIGTPS